MGEKNNNKLNFIFLFGALFFSSFMAYFFTRRDIM